MAELPNIDKMAVTFGATASAILRADDDDDDDDPAPILSLITLEFVEGLIAFGVLRSSYASILSILLPGWIASFARRWLGEPNVAWCWSYVMSKLVVRNLFIFVHLFLKNRQGHPTILLW